MQDDEGQLQLLCCKGLGPLMSRDFKAQFSKHSLEADMNCSVLRGSGTLSELWATKGTLRTSDLPRAYPQTSLRVYWYKYCYLCSHFSTLVERARRFVDVRRTVRVLLRTNYLYSIYSTWYDNLLRLWIRQGLLLVFANTSGSLLCRNKHKIQITQAIPLR